MTDPLTTLDLRYYARVLLAQMTVEERAAVCVAACECLTARVMAPWVVAEAAGIDLDLAIRAEMADVMRHPEATR